jgi:hypothetical protein
MRFERVQPNVLDETVIVAVVAAVRFNSIAIGIDRFDFRAFALVDDFTFRSYLFRIDRLFEKFVQCFRYRSIRSTILK